MPNLVSPWGISRFKPQSVGLPASVALTQSETAPWTFTGATPSFTPANISLSPSVSPCTATLTLGSFSDAPYQILALIQALTLNWAGPGISSANVALVGIDNAFAPLATAPGTYEWPANPAASKYGGSWGQDFGVGFTASDHGSDALGTGISVAEMASAETSFVYQLLLGRTAAKLVFTFTLSDSSQPIALDYPVFVLPGAAPTVIQETGDTAIAIYTGGPAVRFGSWNWWSGGAWQDPPLPRPFGQVSTVLDWLAWKRVAFVPEEAESGLDAEIDGLYDAVEQRGRADIAAGTNAYLATANDELTGVLVNSIAEVPPIAVFPGKSRGTDLQPNGPYSLESWSHAKGPRDIVSAQLPADLFDASGAQWSGPLGGAPAGWSISRFDRAVTNDEDTTFTIRANGVTYANVSPWHGYSCVLFPASGTSQPWVVQSSFGELHLAYVDAGDIHYKWSPSPEPQWQVQTQVTGDGGWANPRMCLDHRGRIELRAVQTESGAETVYRFVSDDDGRSWTSPEAL